MSLQHAKTFYSNLHGEGLGKESHGVMVRGAQTYIVYYISGDDFLILYKELSLSGSSLSWDAL